MTSASQAARSGGTRRRSGEALEVQEAHSSVHVPGQDQGAHRLAALLPHARPGAVLCPGLGQGVKGARERIAGGRQGRWRRPRAICRSGHRPTPIWLLSLTSHSRAEAVVQPEQPVPRHFVVRIVEQAGRAYEVFDVRRFQEPQAPVLAVGHPSGGQFELQQVAVMSRSHQHGLLAQRSPLFVGVQDGVSYRLCL